MSAHNTSVEAQSRCKNFMDTKKIVGVYWGTRMCLPAMLVAVNKAGCVKKTIKEKSVK